jgi:hypothetical protein
VRKSGIRKCAGAGERRRLVARSMGWAACPIKDSSFFIPPFLIPIGRTKYGKKKKGVLFIRRAAFLYSLFWACDWSFISLRK